MSPTTSSAIQHVCSVSPSPEHPISIALSKNVFALSIVLAALHAVGWTRDHARWTEKSLLNGFDGVNGRGEKPVIDGEEQDESKATLARGLDYFQVSFFPFFLLFFLATHAPDDEELTEALDG